MTNLEVNDIDVGSIPRCNATQHRNNHLILQPDFFPNEMIGTAMGAGHNTPSAFLLNDTNLSQMGYVICGISRLRQVWVIPKHFLRLANVRAHPMHC